MSEKTATTKWVEENIHENKEELMEIAELASQRILNCIAIRSTCNDTILAIYAHTFETLCNCLAEKQKNYRSYEADVASTFRIGYNTTESEDDEKQGNFMIYMSHLDNPHVDAILDDEETSTVNLTSMWNATNIKKNPEFLREVANEAMKDIKQLVNVAMSHHEFIIPMLCITHYQIIHYLSNKRNNLHLNEYELNIMGLFTAGCAVNDNGDEEFYFVPSITMKLKFKNDSIASSND